MRTSRTDRHGPDRLTARLGDDRGERAVGQSATRLVFAVGSVALLVDVLTKRLAVRELTGREPVEVIGDFLQLRLVRNPGAAFSAGASLTPVISVVALIATVVIVYFAFRVRSRGWAVGLGLLLAGVGGNLDRPDVPRARAVPRPRRRLLRAAALAGVQRRRHLHRRRRGRCSWCC